MLTELILETPAANLIRNTGNLRSPRVKETLLLDAFRIPDRQYGDLLIDRPIDQADHST